VSSADAAAIPERRWGRRLPYPALAIAAMMASLILARTGRDALYLQDGGLLHLPFAYLGIAALSAPMAALILWLMRLLGPRPARVAATLITAAILAVFHRLAQPGGGPLMTFFYIMVPLTHGVLLSMTWLLTADLFDGAPRTVQARAYSMVAMSGVLGGLLGGVAARSLAGLVTPQTLLLVAAGSLVLAAAIIALGQRECPTCVMALDGPSAVPGPPGGEMPGVAAFWCTLRERYVVLLLAIAVLAAFAGVLIEFQFYMLVAADDAREYTVLLANFYLVLTAVTALLQLVALPPLRRRFGLFGSMMVLPALLAPGALLVVVGAGSLSRVALRVVEGGVKASIHRVSWEQSYLPLPRSQRAVVKLVIDGMAARMGEGMAAAVFGLWLWRAADQAGPPSGIGWLALTVAAVSVLWLSLTGALGSSLRHALDREALRTDLPLPDG